MTLTDLVPSWEACQQLKVAGFPQGKSALVYLDTYDPLTTPQLRTRDSLRVDDGQQYDVIVDAPTAEEILKELPGFLNKRGARMQLVATKETLMDEARNGWLVEWYAVGVHGLMGGVGVVSLSLAAARTYLWWRRQKETA
jgi:hypothetical protein